MNATSTLPDVARDLATNFVRWLKFDGITPARAGVSRVEQAITLGQSRFWESMTAREIAAFQLADDVKYMCVPLGVLFKALNTALDRPVLTHEFYMNRAGLLAELLGDRPKPTWDEVIGLIPEEKRIVIMPPRR